MRTCSTASQESPATAVRQIACADDADLFATAEFESRVETWSITQRSRLCSFSTIVDFGGRRLGFSSGPRPKLVAGAYNRYGVRAYDPLSGEEIWRRPELKQVQTVHGTPYGVAVGVERGPLRLLDASTGELLQTFRGVSELYAGPGRHALAEGHSGTQRIELIDLGNDGRRVWRSRLESFALLDAAIGIDAVAFSEVGACVRCLDFEGVERWRWTPPPELHVRALEWLSDRRLAGVLQVGGHPAAVLIFDRHGNVESAADVPGAVDFAFAAGGGHLVASVFSVDTRMSTGIVLELPSATVTWAFRPAAPLSVAS
jgi:hypothetical protein